MTGDTVGAASAAYRKKRIKRIKRIIVGTCIFLLLFPTILSIILMFKVSSLERQIQVIAENRKQEETLAGNEAEAKSKKKQVKPTAIPEKKRVYLTFDDGPGAQTGKILDVLKKEDVKATFFVTGKEDEFAKKLYKRIVNEGHTLGMHSYSHIPDVLYDSEESFAKDFKQIYELLYQVTGKKPMFYRFPGGSGNESISVPVQSLIEILQEKNVTYMDWNVISPDIGDSSTSKQQMVSSIVEGVNEFDASVVLLYDSEERPLAAKALPSLIQRLKNENYELLPMDGDTPLVQHNR